MNSCFWWCSHPRGRATSVGSAVAEHEGAAGWRTEGSGISRRWIYGAWQSPTRMRDSTPLDEVRDLSSLVASSPVSISTPEKGEQMNHYAHLARQYWSQHAPIRLSQLENPQRYFQTLGDSVAMQIEEISEPLERALPPDLDYVEKVAQLNTIRKAAEEQVLGELVYSIVDPAPPAQRLEELQALLPSLEMIEESLARIQDDAQEQARLDGFEEPILDADQQERTDRLNQLAQLLQTQTNTPQETSALVQQLERFLVT